MIGYVRTVRGHDKQTVWQSIRACTADVQKGQPNSFKISISAFLKKFYLIWTRNEKMFCCFQSLRTRVAEWAGQKRFYIPPILALLHHPKHPFEHECHFIA
jgi:hypothetical protein